MKSKLYKFLLAASIFLPMFSCSDDNDTMPERNQLVVTPSEENVVLTETDSQESVLTFHWNTATNIGSDYSFTYIFQLDIADNNFATATDMAIVEPDGTIGFSAGELYNLIVEKWGRTAGQPVEIEARVVARVDGPYFQYPEIATTKVSVTTYVPVSRPMYITGTATPGGADLANATLINEISNGRIYGWRGKLVPGTFKFITELGKELPSYNMGNDNHTLVRRDSASDPDNLFEAFEEGTYSMYISLGDMSIAYTKVQFEHLYLVGDATTAGWDLDNMPELTPDYLNPNILTYTGPLAEGEMKILSDRSWGAITIRPLKADGNINSDTVIQIAQPDQPDYKWKITTDQVGTYKITLNLDSMTINFEKN